MSQHSESFDLAALRSANLLRLPQFKNRRGEPAHSEPDGSDWCLAQWCNATAGELGEAANLIKKIERGDVTLEEAREDLGREFGDVLTYLDILAMRAGIDLGLATLRKFNEVSERVGSSIRLEPDRAVQLALALPIAGEPELGLEAGSSTCICDGPCPDAA